MSHGEEVFSNVGGLPRRVDKPWGHEIIWAQGRSYVGKLLYIKAGCKLSYQYHRIKEETVYVLSGRVRLYWANDDGEPTVVEAGPGSTFHVEVGLRHRFEAIDDVTLVEASTTELDDVVRLDDDYGRAPS